MAQEIKRFKGMNNEITYNVEFTSNTVNHFYIRQKAKTRVMELLLKDELIRVEKERKMLAIIKQQGEEKEIKLIKNKANDFKNSKTNDKYKQYAKEILLTRHKLNQSMKAKTNKSSVSYRNSITCDNKTINISQRNKIDLSSYLIQTIRDKSNTFKPEIKENDNNKTHFNNNELINYNSNKCSYSGYDIETNLSLKNKRIRDLTQFLSHFNIKTNTNIKNDCN